MPANAAIEAFTQPQTEMAPLRKTNREEWLQSINSAHAINALSALTFKEKILSDKTGQGQDSSFFICCHR